MDWREMAGRSTLTPSSSTPSSLMDSATWSGTPTKKKDAFWFLGHGDIDAHVDPENINKASPRDGSLYQLGGWRLSLEHSSQVNIEHDHPESTESIETKTESKESEKTRGAHTVPRSDHEDKGGQLANPSIKDPLRGWVISIGWVIASGVECVFPHLNFTHTDSFITQPLLVFISYIPSSDVQPWSSTSH